MKIFLIALLFSSCFNLLAQDETADPKRVCRLYFLNRTAEAPKNAYLFDGKDSYEVYLSGKSFSNPIELPSGDITLGLTADRVATPDEFPKGAPTVKISANLSDIYLLLYTDSENEVFPVKIKVISVTDQTLKPGETLWFNFTKHNVAAKLGDNKLMIPPAKRVISPAPIQADGYYPAMFAYQPYGEGEFLKVLNKSWRFQLNTRSLGFIIDSGGRRPEIFTIKDTRVPAKPESPPSREKKEVDTF